MAHLLTWLSYLVRIKTTDQYHGRFVEGAALVAFPSSSFACEIGVRHHFPVAFLRIKVMPTTNHREGTTR